MPKVVYVVVGDMSRDFDKGSKDDGPADGPHRPVGGAPSIPKKAGPGHPG